jgi:hypothetical protein
MALVVIFCVVSGVAIYGSIRPSLYRLGII